MKAKQCLVWKVAHLLEYVLSYWLVCFGTEWTLKDVLEPLTSAVHGEQVDIVVRKRAVLKSVKLAVFHSPDQFG